MKVEPNTNGEKAMAINYEFKLELDRQMTISSFQSAAAMGPALQTQERMVMAPNPPAKSGHTMPTMPAMSGGDQARIKAELAKLSPEDRKLAETQVVCAVDQSSPLGSMGPIHKVMIKDQPVFLCCPGCVKEARSKPDETLAEFKRLMAKGKK